MSMTMVKGAHGQIQKAYFTEGHTNLPQEAIRPKVSDCFLRGSILVFLRKHIATYFPGGVHASPLWIRSWTSQVHVWTIEVLLRGNVFFLIWFILNGLPNIISESHFPSLYAYIQMCKVLYKLFYIYTKLVNLFQKLTCLLCNIKFHFQNIDCFG